jgi:hypothetical protein
MAQPGNVTYRLLYVVNASGVAVTGLTLSSFTVQAYARGYGGSIMTTYSAGSVLQEIGSGLYDLSFLLPAAAGFFSYRIAPNTVGQLIVGANIWSGEVETQDFASINANIVVPVATVTTSAILGMTLPLECIAYRYRTLAAIIKTQSGATVDLTQYSNFKLSIRSLDQTTTKWDCAPGVPYGVAITGDNAGNLTIDLPESASGPLYVQWAAATAHSVGDFVVPNATNGWIYRCTTAGTTGGSHPTWPTTLNSTVTDNGLVWTAVTKPIWQASSAVAIGTYVRPQTSQLAQYWICTTAGTSAGSEPTWPANPAAGATITDNTAVYTFQSDWFAALVSAGANAVQSIQLYYELTGDAASASDETQPIIRSSNLTLSVRQVGT